MSGTKQTVQAADSELRVSAPVHLAVTVANESAALCCHEQQPWIEFVIGLQCRDSEATIPLRINRALRGLLCVSPWRDNCAPTLSIVSFCQREVRNYKDRIKIACWNCSTWTRQGRSMSDL